MPEKWFYAILDSMNARTDARIARKEYKEEADELSGVNPDEDDDSGW